MSSDDSKQKQASRSVYIVARARCRQAGVSMESAGIVISALHALHLHTLGDVVLAVKSEASSSDAAKKKRETKSDADNKQGETSPGTRLLIDKVRTHLSVVRALLMTRLQVARELPKGAKSAWAFPAAERTDEVPSLVSMIRSTVNTGTH